MRTRWVRVRRRPARASGLPHPHAQLLMSDLSYVVIRLAGHYGHEEVHVWLYARHLQLDGARVIDLGAHG